jgi:prophage regulatory protein
MDDSPKVSQILRRPDVERRTGLSCSALYTLMQRGEFPRPLKLTSKSVGWPIHVVDEWLQSRMEAA